MSDLGRTKIKKDKQIVLYSVYSPDEIYLVNEMEHLNKKFKVKFFSRDVSYGNNVRVKQGEDISVKNVKTIGGVNKWLYVSQLFFDSYFWREIKSICKSGLSLGKIKKSIWFAFLSKYEAKQILNSVSVSDDEAILLYSYRLNSGCLTLIRVKDELRKIGKRNVQLVARGHGIDLYADRNRDNFLPFRQEFYEKIDLIYVISDHGANYLRENGRSLGVKVSRLGTKDYGVQSWKKSSETIRIVSCSRVDANKRLEKIVESFSYIENLSVEWIHIGNGECLESVRQLADRKLKNNIKVSFLGEMNNADIMNFYSKNSVDCFLNVSYEEGIPVAIMEAISFGIPIVATDVGGVGEIVRDQYNGFLINRDFSIEDLVEKINLLYSMPDEDYRIMRTNARNMWESMYNRDRCYSDFCKELDQL